jgi:hypothetical protein
MAMSRGVSWRWAALCFCVMALTGGLSASAAEEQSVYIWHEAEALLTGERWLTHHFWAPSGGLFIYAENQWGPPAIGTIKLWPERWMVWMRCRDETQGLRQACTDVNGRRSYLMGGTDSGQWIWYAVGVVHGDCVELAVHQTSLVPMNEWIDTVLVTNDAGFVPPGCVPSDKGYTDYQVASDPGRGQRPAWIWWPRQPRPGSVGFYRKVFELAETPVAAELRVAALGAHKVWINGKLVLDSFAVDTFRTCEIGRHLHKGKNVVAAQVMHVGFLPGLNVRVAGRIGDEWQTFVVSDLTWCASGSAGPDWTTSACKDLYWCRPWARVGEREHVGFYDQAAPTMEALLAASSSR